MPAEVFNVFIGFEVARIAGIDGLYGTFFLFWSCGEGVRFGGCCIGVGGGGKRGVGGCKRGFDGFAGRWYSGVGRRSSLERRNYILILGLNEYRHREIPFALILGK